MYDEKGNPKSNVKLGEDKPVRILFDVEVKNDSTAINDSNYILSDDGSNDQENEETEKHSLACAFWNFKISNWSSDGCVTSLQTNNEGYNPNDGKLIVIIYQIPICN